MSKDKPMTATEVINRSNKFYKSVQFKQLQKAHDKLCKDMLRPMFKRVLKIVDSL